MIHRVQHVSVLSLLLLFALFFHGCSADEKQFTLLSADQTNIHFDNVVESTPEFNIINYMYFYDGAGLAVGDLNNNGLPDLFFVGNQESNRLYMNQGDFSFEDVTDQAGVGGDEGTWSTGATMADISGNGYLDIYVSRVNYLNKSGPNQLFVNNGDGTFTESAAEYGIDFEGYSTQAVFFDYNRSGKLDLFILNHSFHSERTYGQVDVLRDIYDPKAGDKLYRNDGGSFTDVTEEAGIISSALGYGLGVAVSDINKNGWPDIYVGNDFHEDDYLYINNGDGTFTEALYEHVGHTSNSSMGNDIADITNDGYPDIISLDMMPEDHDSYMRSGGPDLVMIAEAKKNFGFGEKNARNTLQINRGNSPDGQPVFSEMAFTTGVAKTDWSWASLFADLDNSGYQDLFVTNGMVRRPNDLDYIARVGDFRDESGDERITDEEFESIQNMPRIKVPNYLYKNHGLLEIEDVTEQWGFDQPSYSSGAAYVDLNRNGMLDMVVSNVNMPAFIYRNNAEPDSIRNYLKVDLNGQPGNISGIGSKVILYKDDEIFYREQMPTRGFQSSVDHQLHIGLGKHIAVDSMLVVWPDWSYETLYDVEANRLVELNQEDASGEFDFSRLHRTYDRAEFENVTADHLPPLMQHRDNDYDDFSQEPLLPYKLSREGPAVAVGDVTGNGLDDLFLGNGHQHESKLYLQQENGEFITPQEELFGESADSEDVDALFFDATGNGHLDLYVVTGGSQLFRSDDLLYDRLYINDGTGNFTRSDERLPQFRLNGSVVKAGDISGDGALDLFVGGRSVPWSYGHSPEHAILKNDGSGNFENVTESLLPELTELGMVTDAAWVDFTENGNLDLVVVGEWMPITVFENRGDRFVNLTDELGLDRTSGMWQSLEVADITGDGRPDLIAGNFGTNSRLQASADNPISLFINDYDDSGYPSGIVSRRVDGMDVPFEQLDELLQEIPELTRAITSYEDYASQSIQSLLGEEKVSEATKRQITEMRSLAVLNRGYGRVDLEPLPIEAQAFPVKDAEFYRDDNGVANILMAGNHYDVKPSYGGRQDAGFGVHLTYSENEGFRALTLQDSGFFTRGEARTLHRMNTPENGTFFLVGKNNQPFELFRKSN